jgi:D-lactate dehydrogenase (cytochrome)
VIFISFRILRLFIGSEGTLAVVTEATLKLHPIPRYAYALRMTFPSVEQAAAAAHATMVSGVTVGRLEMLDDAMVSESYIVSVCSL